MLDDVLDTRYLGNTLGTWLVTLGVVAATYLTLVLVRRVALRRLEKFSARTVTSIDDLALGLVRRTRTSFLLAIAVVVAAHSVLTMRTNMRFAVDLLAKLAFLLQAATWGNTAITFWLQRITAQKAGTDRGSVTTFNVIGVVLRIVLWTLIGLLALESFGVNVTALVTGLGIAGVAVALAVQNVLGDLLASLSIALDKPFVIGDVITVDAFTGTVEHIGLKSTRLRSLSGEQIIMSNAEMLKARIRNYRDVVERRVVTQLNLQYETPPELVEKAPQIVRAIIEAQPKVRLDRVHFAGFTESALVIEAVYFVLSGDYGVMMDTQQRVNVEIMRRFVDEGIQFAVPTRTVVLVEERGGARGEARAEGWGGGRGGVVERKETA